VVSIPSHFRGRARRDAAAFYLAQLAQGLLTGELGVLTGHETITVHPTDLLVIEIAFTQKARVNHVSVRVRWPRRLGPDGATVGRQRPRDIPGRLRVGGHSEFTLPSSGRNAETRDSHTDADHR
jgi:amphi-Trp domain-containing protein